MNAGKEQIKRATYRNNVDDNGNPAGGIFTSEGMSIRWQTGPLRNADGSYNEPNGAFIETAIFAAIQRLQHFQNSKFNCRENAVAITHLETALLWLHKRTEDREERGVEGTYAV